MRIPLLIVVVALAACGHGRKEAKAAPAQAPQTEFAKEGPDWTLRTSGVFSGVRGSSLIEGIASATSQDAADEAACKEIEKILRRRFLSVLPATESESTMPKIVMVGDSLFDRWRNPTRGTYMSLCVMNRDGVRHTVEQTFRSLQREFMLVQLDLILPQK